MKYIPRGVYHELFPRHRSVGFSKCMIYKYFLSRDAFGFLVWILFIPYSFSSWPDEKHLSLCSQHAKLGKRPRNKNRLK